MPIDIKDRDRSLVALSAELARHPTAHQRAFALCVLSRCEYEIADPAHLLAELSEHADSAPHRSARRSPAR